MGANSSTVALDNAMPAAVVYEPGTITLGGVPKTDAVDGDECSFTAVGNKVTCNISMLAGASGVINWSGILQ